MNAVAKPKAAASVILLRPAEPQGFEVLLTRRRNETPSLGERYCFPGGSVHESDHADGMLRRCRGLSTGGARKIIGAHVSPPQALGFWIAAARVLFEKAGLLLAVKESGEPIAVEAEADAGLRAKRAALVEQRLGFHSILESENLFCDAATIRYFSHWRAESPDSGDTRIFLAAMPEGQPPPAAAIEGARWLAPDRALQLFNRGELTIAFPTFVSLRTLADFDDMKSALRAYQLERS